MEQTTTDTEGCEGCSVRPSIIGNLVRDGMATQTTNRRTIPTLALRAALPGTVFAYPPAPTQADVARLNIEAFLAEAEGDGDDATALRRAAREQGIDVEQWAQQLQDEALDHD